MHPFCDVFLAVGNAELQLEHSSIKIMKRSLFNLQLSHRGLTRKSRDQGMKGNSMHLKDKQFCAGVSFDCLLCGRFILVWHKNASTWISPMWSFLSPYIAFFILSLKTSQTKCFELGTEIWYFKVSLECSSCIFSDQGLTR